MAAGGCQAGPQRLVNKEAVKHKFHGEGAGVFFMATTALNACLTLIAFIMAATASDGLEVTGVPATDEVDGVIPSMAIIDPDDASGVVTKGRGLLGDIQRELSDLPGLNGASTAPVGRGTEAPVTVATANCQSKTHMCQTSFHA